MKKLLALVTMMNNPISEETWVAAMKDLGDERQRQQERAEAAEAEKERYRASRDQFRDALIELQVALDEAEVRIPPLEAECVRLRARLEAATERHWWVCTDWLRNGGRKKLGPFTTERDALVARQYVERAERTDKYFVDSDRAAGDS